VAAVTILATALLLLVAGYAYLALLGTAVGLVALPRRWLPLAPLTVPLLGWAALVALGYPLNTVLPFRLVAPLLGGGAAVVVLYAAARHRLRWRRRWWRECGPPLLLALGGYLVATTVHARQGALTALVVDSDVEHFADVVAALLHYPIGTDIAAQEGLEATPIGLAYHYVHATLSAVTGRDAFGTALPSHFLMLALGICGVYVFARSFTRLSAGAATLATTLYACGALPLVVAAFGWGQQTAALATVPVALAALRLGVTSHDRRSLWGAGLLGALAAGSLYLATAPLVGGAAAAMATVTAARRRSATPLLRLVAIGAVVVAAGLFSHLSAGAFLWQRASAGLLRPEELSGRSTHVFDFAAPDGLAGVAPLALFREAGSLDGAPLLAWPAAAAAVAALATAAALLLVLAGIFGSRRARPALPAVLAVVLLYEAYLRWLRPFPYGEFKLLSTVGFLVPVLAVAGWTVLSGRLRRLPLGTLALAVYALGVGLTWGHSLRYLSVPWGAVLPETAMADARSVARAIRPGASVYVSGQLTPAQALEGDGAGGGAAPPGGRAPTWALTANRAGFSSTTARTGYLTKRWRGVLTNLLAFDGHPVYGLVQRHSTELRAPARPGAADYLVLDSSDDPRLFDALPDDLVLAAGTLRLYRQAHRPGLSLLDQPASGLLRLTASGAALTLQGDGPAPPPGGAPDLPPPVLPIGESLPGRRQGLAPALRPLPASGPAGGPRGRLLLGFHAIETAHLRVTLRQPDGSAAPRELVLAPGLTWYTTPEAQWPATVEVTLPATGDRVRPVSATVLVAGGGESLERSLAGTVWPLLTFAAGVPPGGDGVRLEAWYTYLGPREGSAQARLRDGSELWLGGQTTPTSLHLGPGGRSWRGDLRPGEAPVQRTSDGRTAPPVPTWDRDGGRRWIWLEVGPDRRAALHEVPLVEIDLERGGTRILAGGAAGVVLPLLAEPAPLPAVSDGTLVKGSAEDLYYVDGGKLRWVSGPDVLERNRIPWRLSVLDDYSLWRLPVGLPLS
jgi:hypothetical protein